MAKMLAPLKMEDEGKDDRMYLADIFFTVRAA